MIRVVLISIDGLRADAVTTDLTPTLIQLAARGASAHEARCVTPSLTIPNHISMVTGLLPTRHGFLENEYPQLHLAGGLFEWLHHTGLTSALYLSKTKLRVLSKAEHLNRLVVTTTGRSNHVVTRMLEDFADPNTRWAFTLIHLAEPDTVGHQEGWASEPYELAVRVADSHVGRILRMLEQTGLMDETLLIITTDHGGIDQYHLRDVPQVRSIPWIAAGAGVSPGTVITRPVGPQDIAPTIMAALGLPVPKGLDGTVIEEVLGRSPASTDHTTPAPPTAP